MAVKISEAYLPDAGKPEGLCPECGPHGNRGAVTLLYSVVPCFECECRADATAYVAVHDLFDNMRDGLTCEGYVPHTPSFHIDPIDGDPWARRVSARVEFHKP